MCLFAEAAQICSSKTASGHCIPVSSEKTLSPLVYLRQIVASVEVWHLNVISALAVTLFVYVQFRSMFIARPRPKQVKHESFTNQKAVKKKEFADKQVGDDMDIIDDHDDFANAKEVMFKGPTFPDDDMWKRSQLFYESMKLRRSVRCFSSRPVPMKIIQNIVKTAGTAPSGGNLQPWTFCVIANDTLKTKIREIVETEEQLNYSRRMGAKWVLDVEHLTVNWNKPYLTEAPYLIVVMKQTYQVLENGERKPTQFAEISTCIATGILLAAIHNVGLVTVASTPLNAGGQIRDLLQRPQNEKVVVLLPVGYPADNAHVPDIRRKPIEEVIRLY